MKRYVGAKSVQHNKVYCHRCLIQHEVLYRYGSEISRIVALRDGLVCVSCEQPLVRQTKEKHVEKQKVIDHY